MNLINNQPHIDKTYLYAKGPYEAKYQFLIYKRESTGLKHLGDPKAFIEYSNYMQDVYNAVKECKTLVVFDVMVADLINNKKTKFNTNQFVYLRQKTKHFSCFITQSYFKIPKDVRLNSTHFFIMKIPNKRELQKIALNHSSDINSKDFIKIYKKCTAESYSFWLTMLLLHQIIL